MSLRKDTLSHAYELLKVDDPKKRRRLAAQVASGELSLVKLREKIEGRPRPRPDVEDGTEPVETAAVDGDGNGHRDLAEDGWTGTVHTSTNLRDDSLVQARHQLADAVEELVGVLRRPTSSAPSRRSTAPTSRST